MQSAIVFGAAGFIGNALVRRLAEEKVDVLAVVRPDVAERPENARLYGLNMQIVKCDLRDTGSLKRLGVTADVFYNCAWEGTDAFEIADWRMQKNNIGWSLEAIDTAAALGCKRYVGMPV